MAAVGIDSIGFYTPGFYIDLRELAEVRGVDPDKYSIGIGQDEQAVAPSNQDIVTMGAAAAVKVLYYSAQYCSAQPPRQSQPDDIGLVIVGTESGVDASKASALFIHGLIGLSSWCRCIEIKEACFGGTAGLMSACDYVRTHPGKRALVIASDIARYGLGTPGEVTQGAGAVAMVVSEDPHILAIEPYTTAYSHSISDFWRPVYADSAIARGRYSTEQYIGFFRKVWDRFSAEAGLTLDDFAAMCFHLPYTKMGMKAFSSILGTVGSEARGQLEQRYHSSIAYSRRVGNIYSGSLYLGLLSLLDNDQSLDPGDRIGFFSYGSGAVGELFTGVLQPGFGARLHARHNKKLLDQRHKLDINEYEQIFTNPIPYSSEDSTADIKHADPRNPFILKEVKDQERIYGRQ